MTWSIKPAGSWGIATTTAPGTELAAALALPGSWPIGLQPQAFVRKDQWFHLAAVPEVDLVDPNTGPVGGSTGVSISGSGFIGATGVTFGGTAATGFLVNSDALITCLTAPHAAGTVNVVVQSPRGNVTVPAGFTYA